VHSGSWDGLPDWVREAIRRNTGGPVHVKPAVGGSAPVALVVSTECERIFVKGVRDEPRARVELRVQPFLPPLAPRLRWHTETAGHLLMGFDYAEGRHPDLAPGSLDLAAVAAALAELGGHACRGLPVLPVEKRWAPFADDPAPLAALGGPALVHTDLTGENIILGDGRSWVVDWAWPSRGAPWLDTAAMVARLIQAGHEPAQAEEWAGSVPAWRAAPRGAIATYAQLRASVATARGAGIAGAWRRYLDWIGQEAA
jgi:hypothetical protein